MTTPITTPKITHCVEVLAPAGAPDCLPAAVAGGANAVYLGLRHFNARGRAENFRSAELARHVAYLHHHGLKCYVVMNTLIHDDEYPKAMTLATAAYEANVDAVIIQDLGVWATLARELPKLKRHASTQMTIHDPSQIIAMAKLGAERVILARELSLDEIATCTRVAHEHGVETEVFVHGALCYAFSGQCLMSNFSGCRSANRGTCAQNCRFDYERSAFGVRRSALDGTVSDSGDGALETKLLGTKHDLQTSNAERRTPNAERSEVDTLISMKDLALAHRIAELADAGVSSLKIEGRLKGQDYVFTTSRVYRAAVDSWAAKRPFDREWGADLLKDVFARTHTDAPLDGAYTEGSRLHRYAPERDRRPDAIVVRSDAARGEVIVTSRSPITAGQGFAFTIGRWNGGFLAMRAYTEGREHWRLVVRSGVRLPPLAPGTPLFRNADHERKREAAAAMATVPIDAVPEPTIAISAIAEGQLGTPLTVTVTVEDGRSVSVTGTMALAPATGTPLGEALFRDKFGAFGGTGFRLEGVELRIDDGLFVSAGELKALRRLVVEALAACEAPKAIVAQTDAVKSANEAVATTPWSITTNLWVAVGSLDAARAAFAAGADQVWLDDAGLDLWGDQPPVIDQTGIPAGRLWLRHPPTAPVSPHLKALGLPVVAGHIGVLQAAHQAGLPTVMDHYSNTFGWTTARAYAAAGASGAVLSLECSSREVQRLAARRDAPRPQIAITVHGRVPSMLTRQDHGVAPGANLAIRATTADGGLPYQIQRRRFGAVGADTVIWEDRRLCAASSIIGTVGLVDAWLLELADLSPEAVGELVAAYLALSRQQTTPDAIEQLAARHAPVGLFPGHLVRGSRELDEVESETGAES